MTYYVTIENGTANLYKAAIIGWPTCIAEGKTREEAVARVKERFTERLNQVEIVPIEVESPQMDLAIAHSEHSWAKFAGMYQSNPLFAEVLDSIQAYRRQLDADETVI